MCDAHLLLLRSKNSNKGLSKTTEAMNHFILTALSTTACGI